MKSSLRIAIFHNLHSGGALRTLWEQVHRLSQNHEVTLFSLSTSDRRSYDLTPFLADEKVWDFVPGQNFTRPFGRLNSIIRSIDLLRLWVLSKKMAGEINNGDFDVILLQPCQFTQSSPLLGFITIPTVYYCQEPLRIIYDPLIHRPYSQPSLLKSFANLIDPWVRIYRFLLKWIDRWALRSADRVLVNSEYSRSNIQKIYGVTSYVCYHGVDVNRFRNLTLEKENNLLSVGALTPHKGFDFLIEAIRYLPNENRPQLRLICNYSEQQEKTYLKELANDYGVTLWIQEDVDDAELIKAYNKTRAVVYAPYREPFGLVPLEAMACCTPVIGVAEGGVTETIIHETNGYLCPRDPVLFSHAIADLLTDPKRASSIGHKARQIVLEIWNWDNAVRRLEEQLYTTLMEGVTQQ